MSVIDKGYGPIGKVCRDCVFARGVTYKEKEIYVCDKNLSDINPDHRSCLDFKEKIEDYHVLGEINLDILQSVLEYYKAHYQ